MSLLFALYTEPIYFFQQTVKRTGQLRTELCTLPTYTSAQRWTTPSRICLFVTLLQNFPVSRQATVVLLQHSQNFEAAPTLPSQLVARMLQVSQLAGACHDHR